MTQVVLKVGDEYFSVPDFLADELLKHAKRAARTGRNPRTGAQINIKAARIPRFRPGKGLKDALN